MKLSRFQFVFSTQEKITFTQFPGSALRGVFGHALKAVSCVTQREHCQGCTQRFRCAFPQVFKTIKLEKQQLKAVPQPLILDTSEIPKVINAGEQFSIYISLVGDSNQYLDSIIQAWIFAGKLGLNSQGSKTTFHLESVHTVDLSLPKSISHSKLLLIDLLTPHRAFRREGEKRRKQLITTKTFITNTYIANIIRRYSHLEHLYGERLSEDKLQELMNASYAVAPVQQSLALEKHHRISQTQNKKIDLSGLVGNITIKGNFETLLPILWLGQWLHVGNNPMYGLGRYHMTGVSYV